MADTPITMRGISELAAISSEVLINELERRGLVKRLVIQQKVDEMTMRSIPTDVLADRLSAKNLVREIVSQAPQFLRVESGFESMNRSLIVKGTLFVFDPTIGPIKHWR